MDHRFPPRGLFVTGTDTEVGKTYVAAAILRELAAAGVLVGAYKPACSGAVVDRDSGTRTWGDVVALRDAATRPGETPPPEDFVCPQRFDAPLAPPAAAAAEGRAVDADRLVAGAAAWRDRCEFLVVEGAGGLLAPLADGADNRDIAAAFGYPLLVVARNRLGTINHTRLTVEAAGRAGLDVAAVVLSDGPELPPDDPSVATNAADLRRWLGEVPLVTLGAGEGGAVDAGGRPIVWAEIVR